MLDVWNLEWVNHNSVRAYPLASHSSRANNTNDFVIPDDAIVGISVSTASDINNTEETQVDVTAFYINCLGLSENTAYFEVSYNGTAIAKGSLNYSDVENTSSIPKVVSLIAIGSVKVSGYIAINNVASLQSLPYGYWYFDNTGCPIDPDCIHTYPSISRAITVVNSDGTTVALNSSTVVLEAGSNINFSVSTANGIDTVTINGIIPEYSPPSGTVTTINGVRPESSGNISLISGECINITPDDDAHAIILEDSCATPCCSCTEMNVLRNKVTELNNMTYTMQAFLAALNAKIYAY